MLPMPKLIDQFGGALGGLTEQQRNAALATIFGSDAVRAANVLLLGGTEAWNDMSTAVSAGGEAAEMAAAQNKGLSGALDGLKKHGRDDAADGCQAAAGDAGRDGALGRGFGREVCRGESAADDGRDRVRRGAGGGGAAGAGDRADRHGAGGAAGAGGAGGAGGGGLAAAWTTDFGGIRTFMQSTASDSDREIRLDSRCC